METKPQKQKDPSQVKGIFSAVNRFLVWEKKDKHLLVNQLDLSMILQELQVAISSKIKTSERITIKLVFVIKIT